MSYVLGFWFADGYMRHERSYRVVFNSQDYQLLLDIRKVLNSEHPIYQRKNNVDYQLIVFSKKLYTKLLNLGGKRCKSRTIKFPKVPNKYLSDFIRGYFDGDGSVFYTTYRSTKNKKMRTELRSNFTSGSPNFLEILQTVLVNILGVSRKKICPFDEGGSWKLGYATIDTVKLLKFMYYLDCPISLERKASFAKDVLTRKGFICRGIGVRFTELTEN